MDRERERRGGEFRTGPSLRRKIRTLFFLRGMRGGTYFYSTEIADTRGGTKIPRFSSFSFKSRGLGFFFFFFRWE